MTLRCPDCHCAGPFAVADDTNHKCPLCARTFESKSLENVAYVDRKRTAVDLMHRSARKELVSRSTATAAPSLDLVVDSLASIIVAGTSFDPETTDKREAISAVLQQANAARVQTSGTAEAPAETIETPPEPLPEAPPEAPAQPVNRIQLLPAEPARLVGDISRPEVAETQESAEPPAASVEVAPGDRLQQLRFDQQQAAAEVQREREKAEEFLLSRARSEAQQTEIAELVSQIKIDRAEAHKLQHQRQQAEQRETQQTKSAQAELKRLQAEHLNVTAQIKQQQEYLLEQQAVVEAEQQRLSESIDKLRSEIDAATVELKSLQSAPETDTLHHRSDIVQQQQELERLQIERLNVADQIAQQHRRTSDRQAAAKLKRQQLTENVEKLREEIREATKELEKQNAPSDDDHLRDDSAVEQQYQELVDQRDAVQAALAKQRKLATERAELQAISAPKKKQLDVLRRETAAGIAELKKLRKANTAPLPQPAELNAEIEKLRTTRGKLARGLQAARKAVSQREAELKEAGATFEAQQKTTQQLKSEISKAKADYESVMARKAAIEEEIKAQAAPAELVQLQQEYAEVQARLENAKQLLDQVVARRDDGAASSEVCQREVRLLDREIRADVRETQDILSAVVREQSASGMRPIPMPRPRPMLRQMERPPGAPLPPLDFSKPLSKGISPVQRATLEPFEDEGAQEDDEEAYLGPPTPDSSEEVREPGSTRITLMSVGMFMVAFAMAGTSVMAGMWLYSGYENGTAILDAFHQCLPIAKIAIPSLWGIGSLLSLLVPRIAGSHSEGIASSISLAGMLGALHLYDGRMTPEIWLVVSVCGILHAYMFQSFMAELCAFGGFHTCEKMSERLMGITTLVLLAALSLGIAWWVRTDEPTQLALTRASVLTVAVLCIATATVVGRILMNVGTEQARGREWLLEHV